MAGTVPRTVTGIVPRDGEMGGNDALHGAGQSEPELGGGGDARPEAPRRHGEIQRGAGEGRRDAGGRRAASQREGRPGPLLRRETDRRQRSLSRDPTTGRRVGFGRSSRRRRRSNGRGAVPIRRGTKARSSSVRSSRRRTSEPSSLPSCASAKSGCGTRWSGKRRDDDRRFSNRSRGATRKHPAPAPIGTKVPAS
jgi:hypothetical protein